MKSSSNESSEDKGNTKPKVTAKQFDEAFDILAAFLFEQYRKHKENNP